VASEFKNFDIYYSGKIQTLPKNKKIKRADKILPEVYGTTLKAVNRRRTDSTTTNRKRIN
jgi:hypothetical protein